MTQDASLSSSSTSSSSDDKISNKESKLSTKYPSEVPNEMVEEQTKKVPNLVFLGLALGSIAGSAFLTFAKSKTHLGNFIGLWAPTFLLLGTYNKLVKIEDELIEVQNRVRVGSSRHKAS